MEFLRSLVGLEDVDLSESTHLVDVSALNTSARLTSLELPYSHLYDGLNIPLDKIDVGVDVEFMASFEPTDEELQEIAEWEEIDEDDYQ